MRAKIKGTSDEPRLCVFRSNKHIYAKIIDDNKGVTIASADEKKIKNLEQDNSGRKGKIMFAYEIGRLIAKKAIEKKIKKIVFDRAGYKYHGRVKALAEGAREGGLEF